MVTELRLDPLSGRWAAIRPQRADRPAAFVDRMAWPTEQRSTCPFCKEHADDEQVLAETTDGGNWTSRVVANRYPAFDTDEPFVVFNKGPVFTEATAGGTHEVVVFCPDHDKSFSELDDHEVADVMALLKERLTAHAATKNLRYTQVIINAGREAGASVEHPHGQLLGISFVPRDLAEEQGQFSRFVAGCVLCVALDAESASGRRTILDTPHALVVAPYWSSVPYEMLLLPRSHGTHVHHEDQDVLTGVGLAIRDALAALKRTVGNVAYNVVLHSAPYNHGEPFHWHVHLWPKATTRAGFEMGTGVSINVMPPELAAEQLRANLED